MICELNFDGNVPAGELCLGDAEREAMLSGGCGLGASGMSREFVVQHSVTAPGALARPHIQATLLRVYCEHGELRLGQRTCTTNALLNPTLRTLHKQVENVNKRKKVLLKI